METDPIEPNRRSPWKLAVLLYPFVWAAVAVNVFLLGLMGPAVGLPSLSPYWSLAIALAPAVWAACASARWVHALIERAEG